MTRAMTRAAVLAATGSDIGVSVPRHGLVTTRWTGLAHGLRFTRRDGLSRAAPAAPDPATPAATGLAVGSHVAGFAIRLRAGLEAVVGSVVVSVGFARGTRFGGVMRVGL